MAALVIVPCGRRKVWDLDPAAGPTPARDAYQGAPFKVNREYAEKFADRWVILSAKYGFIDPDFVIADNYDVTFARPESRPITLDNLRRQVEERGLSRYDLVVVLGGSGYSSLTRQAFRDSNTTVVAPVAGLPIGLAMSKVRRAIDEGRPFIAE